MQKRILLGERCPVGHLSPRPTLHSSEEKSQVFPRSQEQAWQGQDLVQVYPTPPHRVPLRTRLGLTSPRSLLGFCGQVLNLTAPTGRSTHGSTRAAQRGKPAVWICAEACRLSPCTYGSHGRYWHWLSSGDDFNACSDHSSALPSFHPFFPLSLPALPCF